MNWKKISAILGILATLIILSNWIDARYVLSGDFKKVQQKIDGIDNTLDRIRIDQLRAEKRDLERDARLLNRSLTEGEKARIDDINFEIDLYKKSK